MQRTVPRTKYRTAYQASVHVKSTSDGSTKPRNELENSYRVHRWFVRRELVLTTALATFKPSSSRRVPDFAQGMYKRRLEGELKASADFFARVEKVAPWNRLVRPDDAVGWQDAA